MGRLKFYRSKHNPTIILDRSWIKEADQIDKELKKICGEDANWTQVFAYGEIANHIYYLFKKGYKSFNLDKISFRFHHTSTYTVILESKVVHTEGTISAV